MTEDNALCEPSMHALHSLIISDSDESKEEPGSSSCEDEAENNAIPPSLLSYFETSKSRAAVCEKLILEDLEDSTAFHHGDGLIELTAELNKEDRTVNELITPETKSEEDITDDEEIKSENEAERQQHSSEDVRKEEQRRQRELDFQAELWKIMEEEKLHQVNLELIKREAQEKLEQELLLQKDFIRKLQKRLERDRGMIEVERKRKKEEERNRMEKEDCRKRETEEKRKRQDDRKRTEEEKSIKYIDIGLKDKDKTRLKEKEKRKNEADENRKTKNGKDTREEERKKKEEEEEKRKTKKEKDTRDEMRKEEGHVNRKSDKETDKREEEMRKKEEADEKRKSEKEKYKKEKGMRKKEEGDEKRKSEKEKDTREEMRKEEEADEKRKSEKEKDKKEEKQRKEEEEEKKRKTKKERDKKEEKIKKKEEGDEKRNSEKEKDKREEEIRKEEVGDENRKSRKEKDKREEEMKKEREEDENRKSEQEKYKKEEEMEKKEEEIKMACKQFREEEMTRQVEEERHEDKGMKNERTSAVKKRRNEERIKSKNELGMMEEMEGEEPITNRSTWVRTKEEEVEKNEEGQEQKPEGEREERETGQLDRRKLDKDLIKIQDGSENVWTSEENNNEDKVKQNTVEDPHVRRGAEEQEHTHAQEEEITLRQETEDHGGNAKVPEHKAEIRHHMEETKEDEDGDTKLKEETGGREGKKDSEDEQMFISQKENNDKKSLSSQNEQKGRDPLSPLGPGLSPSEASVRQACSESAQDPLSHRNISLPVSLPEHTEQKRLSWIRDCIGWSQLSLHNTRRQNGSVLSGRRRRRACGASRPPPLCPHTLLRLSGCTALQEVTTVTLEDLPCCGLSTLAQCPQLRSLSLRRCGLKSLEGVGQLRELCYIDLQENEISLVDCEHMTGLRVLRLARNKLTTIHGLSGADNLNILDLSHNSITRIAGLESVTRLQRLSVAHNQLISTKGLRDVYTLLHLDLSHNHLTRVEGLENSALLHTLDLRSNSLSEPPGLNNQVLLREVRLDDNSISSVEGLAACWLPLMQTLSVSQNRITQLPSMTDFVSLENMDLRFNCLSELQNVCESLTGCHFLREVHLLGNPLEQDRGWRPTLQKALPGLRAIDSQQTDSFPSALAGQRLNAVPGCFLTLCQAQLQQTQDLQQRHSEELSRASSPLDAVKSFSRHFAEAQKLAEDQRFAHEYGDTTVSENTAAVQTIAEKASNVDLQTAEGCIYWPEMDTASKGTAVVQRKNNIRSNSGSFEEKPAEEINGERTSLNLDKVILSGFHDLGHKKSAAAVSIQRRWRKYRQKCGNVDASIVESEWKTKGDGEEPESGSPFSNRSAAGRDHAATVIQAFWRGFALRRRLACALAAVTWPDAGEEDAFEEVDVEEFVFDEPELEKYWTVTFSEDSPPRHCPKSQQPLSPKPPVSVDDPSQYFRSPPLVQSPRQAWMAEQQVDSVGQRISLASSNRSRSPASSSRLSGLSERSEKILEEWGFTDSRTAQLMLKRAQRMKLTKKQQKNNSNPSLRLAVIENCTYERGPVEARNRPAQCNRYSLKVGEAGLGLQQAERLERMRREKAPHGQRTRTDQPDSVHFLPEMNSSILQGGKVQLVAGGPDRPHATGLWANSCLADHPGKANMYSGRNSLGHEKKEVSSPKRAASAPSKKERISFRDNPVQLSGGWGGGKKRDRLHKHCSISQSKERGNGHKLRGMHKLSWKREPTWYEGGTNHISRDSDLLDTSGSPRAAAAAF
ncbi:uncharacterized protein lrriq1 [Menidia menidia]